MATDATDTQPTSSADPSAVPLSDRAALAFGRHVERILAWVKEMEAEVNRRQTPGR